MFSEKMKEIIHEHNMSARPAHYSGRSMNYGDLNDKQIFGIHKSIQDQFGVEQAKAFVQMVKDTPILSACEFLQALDFLESNNFKWKKEMINHLSAVPAEKDEFSATMMGLMHKLSDNTSETKEVSKSNYLKQHFLSINLSKKEYDIWIKENYKADMFGDPVIRRHF